MDRGEDNHTPLNPMKWGRIRIAGIWRSADRARIKTMACFAFPTA